MKVWLVTIGEPIFHSENKLRLHRTGILAKHIANATNHEVTWWTSTFNHFTKKHDYPDDVIVDVSPQLKMIAVKGTGYKRNISISRILDHSSVAKKISKYINSKKIEKPDIVVVAFPTIGLCEVFLKYGYLNKIPVLIDYRDMWPEVYVDILPQKFQFIGRFFLRSIFNKVDNLFSGADGILGITQDFLNLALLKAKRSQIVNDGVFPLGYLLNQYSEKDIKLAEFFWDKKIDLNSKRVRICFFGAIGYQSNWDTIAKAAEILKSQNINVEFIICGSGDKLDELKSNLLENDHILFPGFVSASQIRVLMEKSHIGLCAYYPKESYLNSIPGKAIEYMSAGLPILSTLKDGTLGKFINEHDIGFHYLHDSHESLIEKIYDILKFREDLASKKHMIREIYFNQFDSKKVYGEYCNHLENVISNYTK
jgi:glycosyltransferase involved in cell wall biosynthesis